MRRGADYLASLRDGRAVFLDGERVQDVTRHPAFAEPIQRIAERYDAAANAPDVTTCVDPATGERIGAMWLMPRSAEDLGRRRAVHRFWAEGSYGLMGRTPDHVASVLTGFAGWRQLFDRGGPRGSATTWSASTSGRATRTSTSPTRSCRPRSTARSRPTSIRSRSCTRAS